MPRCAPPMQCSCDTVVSILLSHGCVAVNFVPWLGSSEWYVEWYVAFRMHERFHQDRLPCHTCGKTQAPGTHCEALVHLRLECATYAQHHQNNCDRRRWEPDGRQTTSVIAHSFALILSTPLRAAKRRNSRGGRATKDSQARQKGPASVCAPNPPPPPPSRRQRWVMLDRTRREDEQVEGGGHSDGQAREGQPPRRVHHRPVRLAASIAARTPEGPE